LGERSGHKISHDALVIEQLLEFDGRGRAMVYAQQSLAAQISRVEGTNQQRGLFRQFVRLDRLLCG
jgi:hypothetical protein